MLVFTPLLLLLSLCRADKDSGYYPGGAQNKNLDQDMYWRDANNVLDDLNRFDALFVTSYGCSLTSYTEDENSQCGGGNVWYEGCSEWPFRPGLSFALYGSLKGAEDFEGCGRATYINSFITTSGPEYFIQALAEAGASFSSYSNDDSSGVSSECTLYEGSGNQNSYIHGSQIYSGATSEGMGCMKRRFALQTFQGAHCDAYSVVRTTNELSALNNDLSQVQCMKIYDRNNYYNNDGNSDGIANVLGASRACSKLEGSECPDPHGLLAGYQKAIRQSTSFGERVWKGLRATFAVVFFIVGMLLCFQALIVYRERRRRGRSPRRIFRRKKQKESTKIIGLIPEDEEPKKFGWRIRRFFSRLRRGS